MCNQLHPTSNQIPEYGVGWKVFEKRGDKLCPIFGDVTYYDTPVHVAVKWDETAYRCGEIEDPQLCGFCFFTRKKDAILELRYLNYGERRRAQKPKFVVRKIKYWNGLGSHAEDRMTIPSPKAGRTIDWHHRHKVALDYTVPVIGICRGFRTARREK